MITKDIIKGSGFLNVEQIEENIFYINDFLSKDELKLFNNLIDGLDEDVWSILNNSHVKSWHNKLYDHNDGILNNIVRQKINNLMSFFPDLVAMGFNRILRQSDGNSMEAHVDEINDQPNGAIREYAAVVYLNDDYIGGEISYVNLNISLKPKAGSLLIFKTGPKYLHEVKTVYGDRPRYCLPAFMFSSWVYN